MLRIIRNLLKQLGFADIDEAGGGNRAMRGMRAGPHGLLISDRSMRLLGGPGGLGGLGLLKEAREAGADDHIVKLFGATAPTSRLVPMTGPF